MEQLIDAWLVAHPEHPPIPHLEDDAPGGVSSSAAHANAAIGATDPGEAPDAADATRDAPAAGGDADPEDAPMSDATDATDAADPAAPDPDADADPDADPDRATTTPAAAG